MVKVESAGASVPTELGEPPMDVFTNHGAYPILLFRRIKKKSFWKAKLLLITV